MINPLVIKLGGVLLDSNDAMTRLFQAIFDYQKSHQRYVLLIHEGNCIIDKSIVPLSVPITKKHYLYINSSKHVNGITSEISSIVNKSLLALAVKHKINAIGLCLSDGKSVAVKRSDKNISSIGQAIPGSPLFLMKLHKESILPIISSIGISSDGELINVNADLAATALAATLSANLILLSDISSILDGKGQRISEITSVAAQELIAHGIITNGMVTKVNAALEASRILKHSVDIASWQDTEKLKLLFDGINIGTRVFASSNFH